MSTITIQKGSNGYFTTQEQGAARKKTWTMGAMVFGPSTDGVINRLSLKYVDGATIFDNKLYTDIINGETATAFASADAVEAYVQTNFFRDAGGSSGSSGVVVQSVPLVTIDDLTANLVAHFDFSDTSTCGIGLSGERVGNVTDKVNGIVATSTGGGPLLMSDGSLGKGFFLRFTGAETLVGSDLLSSNPSYSLYVIRRIAPGTTGSSRGVFQHGTGDGYGIVDFQDAGSFGGKLSGGFYPNRSVGVSSIEFTTLNKWQVIGITHDNADDSVKEYDTIGRASVVGTANPILQTGGFTIGGCNSCNNFIGDLSEILLFDGVHTDAQALRVCNYLTQRNIVIKPANINITGHSKMTNAGGSPDILDNLVQLLMADGYYVSQYNWAQGGSRFDQIITKFSANAPARIGTGTQNIFAFMLGHNDLGSSTADQLIQDAKSLLSAARSVGYKVVFFTEIRSTINSGVGNAEVDTYNNFWRGNWQSYADGLVDADALIDYTDIAMLPDGVHPSPAACLIIATAAKAVYKLLLS